MRLDRAGLLSLATLDREDVALPGGGLVSVRCMTVAERDRMEDGYQKAGKAGFRSRLIAATACDESGALLFPDADLAAIGALPFGVAEPIVEAAIRVNRMGADEKAALGNDSRGTGTSG
jgi:hypothetical protein